MPAPGDKAETAAPAAAAAAAPAEESGGSSSQVLTPSIPTFGADGALRYSYGLDLPAFHGLEPEIALNYDSGRKTKLGANYQGWLGFGWGLEGFDMIERQRPKGGVPAFDASDVYLLNGTELVPCTANMDSPSCAAGGNYATEVESYQRIRNDPGNIWTVTQRDGTRLYFYPMASFATAALGDSTVAYYSRWYLQRVIDTHGNTVTYDYDCTDGTVCYPKAITYGNYGYAAYQVKFNLEDRPDHILMANGRTISRTAKRVRSVKVTANGATASAYALYYEQAPGSNNSRLKYVYRYGTDAVIDAGGTVASGTGLPRVEFAYRDFNTVGTGYDTRYASWEKTITSECTDANKALKGQLTFADIDNNGNDELLYVKGSLCNNVGGYTKIFLNKFNFTDLFSYVNQSSTLHQFIDSSGVRLVGNFLGVGAFKSIITYYNYPQYDQNGTYIGNISYNKLITFDGTLNVQVSDCPNSNSPYAEDCIILFQGGNVYSAADVNRYTVDISNETKISQVPDTNYGFAGTGDFNGTGLMRPVVNIGKDVTTAYVYNLPMSPVLGGAGVDAASIGVANKDGKNNATRLVDVNGDGLTDVLFFWTLPISTTLPYTSALNIRVYLATGNSFVLNSPVNAPTIYGNWAFSDLDDDGRINLITQSGALNETDQTASHAAYDFRYGSAVNLTLIPGFAAIYAPRLGMGDINGDSLPDFPVKLTGSNYFKFLLSGGSEGLPNSLLSVKNELGGVHSFKFKPSTRYVNTILPFAMSTIAEISADDGRGGVGVQKISYAGGKYDPVLRRFMGFQKVTETQPCPASQTSCPTVETTYRQDVASVGLTERVVVKDGGGTVRRDVTETYLVNSTAKPYSAKNTATVTVLTENVAATLKTERGFDAYGNVDSLKDYGRVDVAGDELWEYSAVTANTAAFIVDKPYFSIVRSGLDGAAPLVKEAYHYYDGQGLGAAPLRGDLTSRLDTRKITPNYITLLTSYAYDSYGNRYSETNALGERTERAFDSAFHLFPVSERDPLYAQDGRHEAKALYEPKCGLPSEKTGFDGVRRTFLYDPFCRPYYEYNTVSGSSATSLYTYFGTPGSQNVAVIRPTLGGNSISTRYFDGFGRVFLENATAGTDGDIRQSTSYDTRGNAVSRSLPYLAGGAPKFVTTTYDWASRPLVTTLPDGAARSLYYWISLAPGGASNPGLSVVTLTDELGRITSSFSSTRGDVVLVQRQLGAGWQYEYRSYDALSRMTGVKDAAGATWTNVYDMLGNRLSAADPDLGTWTYDYDGANRLISQTDARGVRTALSYDKLGRLLHPPHCCPRRCRSAADLQHL